MIRFDKLEDIRIETGTAVTVGKFDGLHLGHRKLIESTLSYRDQGLRSVVMILVSPEHKRILTDQETDEILENWGVDYVIRVPLDKTFMSTEASAFLEDTLIGKLSMKVFVSGADFRFGRDRMGDSTFLTENAAGRYCVETLDKDSLRGSEISSTRLREALSEGELREAEKLTGRAYSISGEVVHGRHLAADLGFPTANIRPSEKRFLPRFGVYYGTALIDGNEYPAVTNLGVKPTVTNENEVLLEAYFPGYKGDLYGREMTVILRQFIRDERKFSSVEDLRMQVQQDGGYILMLHEKRKA